MRPELPNWLKTEETYAPNADRDAFIDRSILTVLGAVSRIRSQAAPSGGMRAHAVFKLSFTLLLIVLLSVSQSPAFVAVVTVAALCALALLRPRDLAAVLKGCLIAVLFTALVLLPAALLGNWYSIGMIVPKVFVSVAAAGILSRGTRWDGLTGALKYFFVPNIFIFVLDIAVKYILLLGEYALEMLQALKLRSVGCNRGKRAALSGIAGTMFLHSRDMASEMHAAMVCRGFSGEYKRPSRFSLNLADAGVIAAAAAAAVLFATLRH